jgi:hypothetical protein
VERVSFWRGSQPNVWGRAVLFHPRLEPLTVPPLDKGHCAILSLAKKTVESTPFLIGFLDGEIHIGVGEFASLPALESLAERIQ